MGSYAELKFDDVLILSSKSYVSDEIISMFQEVDRRVRPDTEYFEENWTTTEYVASREDILFRLDVLGITKAKAENALEAWLEEQREGWNEAAGDEPSDEWYSEILEFYISMNPAQWMKRIPEALRTRYDTDRISDDVEEDFFDRSFIRDDDWMAFAAADSRLGVRLALEAFREAKEVSINISDLIRGGWLEENVALCDDARAPDTMARPALEPTVIMAEGKSDIRALQASLKALYPTVLDSFTFFDHEPLKVDGGANFLLKFIKALAAAKMPLNVVAIFDNDAAGRTAYNSAKTHSFPANIQVLLLPEIELARDYPTFGPQGVHLMDVNGCAVGIEMFMGRENLINSKGCLRPVIWGGYVKAVEAYQGEIDEKLDVQKRFSESINVYQNPLKARKAFPELDQLWQAIFAVLR